MLLQSVQLLMGFKPMKHCLVQGNREWKHLNGKKISIVYAKSIETHQIGILKTRSTTVKQELQQGILYNDPLCF